MITGLVVLQLHLNKHLTPNYPQPFFNLTLHPFIPFTSYPYFLIPLANLFSYFFLSFLLSFFPSSLSLFNPNLSSPILRIMAKEEFQVRNPLQICPESCRATPAGSLQIIASTLPQIRKFFPFFLPFFSHYVCRFGVFLQKRKYNF